AVAVCSSRIDHEAGVVTVTTPGAVLEVGHRFLVVDGIAYANALERQLRKASLSWATWAASLASPAATNAAVVPDPVRLTEAQERRTRARSARILSSRSSRRMWTRCRLVRTRTPRASCVVAPMQC